MEKGLLSNSSVRATLRKVILGDILFWMQIHLRRMLSHIKMNEIANKFLLAGEKFIPEMHLKQPGFTCSAFGPFTKNKERIQKFKKREIQTIFTKMNLIKLAFNMIWHMEILKI